jgi:hypothetical protein
MFYLFGEYRGDLGAEESLVGEIFLFRVVDLDSSEDLFILLLWWNRLNYSNLSV